MPAPGPGKALCGAQRPNQPKGVTCKLVAGHRTDHVGTGYCWRHGGLTPSHKIAADREATRQACELFGLEMDHRDPGEVLLDEVVRARRAIAWHEREIAMAMQDGDTELMEKRLAGWQAERKQAADVSARAVHLGIAARRLEVEEGFARQMAAVMQLHVELLGLDPSSPRVRKAGREALQLVAGGQG